MTSVTERSRDWFQQPCYDLEHAREAQRIGHHDWACFASHQAAEKAVKALHQSLLEEAWSHVVRRLLEDLPEDITVPRELIERARVLDGHYIPTRYPNGHPEGTPFDHYGELQSGEAIAHAEAIITFVRVSMAPRG
jgi:HEPN domain-containing protein